jgi:tryptophan synthase
MGVTGSSSTAKVSESLPQLVARIKETTPVPLAVGFGIASREQFEYVATSGAEGGVIGSRIVSIIDQAGKDPKAIALAVQKYCSEITGRSNVSSTAKPLRSTLANSISKVAKQIPTTTVSPMPARFGDFGGQYVPESLVDCLNELERAHSAAREDPAFWKEFESYYGYINRPSQLYHATRLTENAGGANIWLKREDL